MKGGYWLLGTNTFFDVKKVFPNRLELVVATTCFMKDK